MKEKILQITDHLRTGLITEQEAQQQLLELFDVPRQLDDLKKLARNGLPRDCVEGYKGSDLKFCDCRNEDGGKCVNCF